MCVTIFVLPRLMLCPFCLPRDPSFASTPEDSPQKRFWHYLLAALAERDREQPTGQRARRAGGSARIPRAGKVCRWRCNVEPSAPTQLYVQGLPFAIGVGELQEVVLRAAERTACNRKRRGWRKRSWTSARKLEQQPVHPEDVRRGISSPRARGAARVMRRRRRRALANFEGLPVTTQVYELSGKERACPCCGRAAGGRRWRRAGRWGACRGTSERVFRMCLQEVCLRTVRLPSYSQHEAARWRWRRGQASRRLSARTGGAVASLAYIVTSKVFRLPTAVPAGR